MGDRPNLSISAITHNAEAFPATRNIRDLEPQVGQVDRSLTILRLTSTSNLLNRFPNFSIILSRELLLVWAMAVCLPFE